MGTTIWGTTSGNCFKLHLLATHSGLVRGVISCLSEHVPPPHVTWPLELPGLCLPCWEMGKVLPCVTGCEVGGRPGVSGCECAEPTVAFVFVALAGVLRRATVGSFD